MAEQKFKDRVKKLQDQQLLKITVPKFTGAEKDWIRWRERISAIFQQLDIEEAVDKSKAVPEADDNQDHFALRRELWVLQNQIAYTFLIQACEDDVFPLVFQSKRVAHVAWSNLCNRYQASTETRVTRLQAQFFAHRVLQTPGKIDEYFNSILTLHSQLMEVGTNIGERTVMRQIAIGLPEQFQTRVEVLLGTPGMTLQGFCDGLRLTAEDIIARSGSANSSSANTGGVAMAVVCFNCSGHGHRSSECPSYRSSESSGHQRGRGRGRGKGRGKDQHSQGSQRADGQNPGSDTGQGHGRGKWRGRGRGRGRGTNGGNNNGGANSVRQQQDARFIFMTESSSTPWLQPAILPWLLDSGSCATLSPYKDDFMDLDLTYRETLQVASSDAQLEIEGRGTALIHTFDSQKQPVVHCVKNALYAPRATRRLYSTQGAMSLGHSFTLSNKRAWMEMADGTILSLMHLSGGVVFVPRIPKSHALSTSSAPPSRDESSGSGISKPTPTDEELQGMSTIFVEPHARAPTKPEQAWHQRLSHIPRKQLQRLLNSDAVVGVNLQRDRLDQECEGCREGHGARTRIKSSSSDESPPKYGPGEFWHLDMIGPITPEGPGKVRWIAVLVDDFSSKKITLVFKHKNMIVSLLPQVFANARLYGHVALVLKSDCAGEFASSEMAALCSKFGVSQVFSAPFTPQQNGVAERAVRTLTEKARSLISSSGLSKVFWPFAYEYAVVLSDRTSLVLDRRDGSFKTPWEIYTSEKPDLTLIRVFGCEAHVINESRKGKLDPTSWTGIHLGRDMRSNTYIVYNPSTNRVVRTRNVTFNETILPKANKSPQNYTDMDWIDVPIQVSESGSSPPPVLSFNPSPNQPSPTPVLAPPHDSPTPAQVPVDGQWEQEEQEAPEKAVTGDIGSESEASSNANPAAIKKRRGKFTLDDDKGSGSKPRLYEQPTPDLTEQGVRTRAQRTNQSEVSMVAFTSDLLQDEEEPLTRDEALRGEHAPQWQAAMESEFQSLTKKRVWEVVERFDGCPVIKGKWVFKIKRDQNGNVARFKSRYVACGYSQIHGVNYDETFAPVAKLTSLRTLSALSVHYGYDLGNSDITTAYLNSDLAETVEDIYVELPDGFRQKGKVGRLLKGLYGLKQAGRLWHQRLVGWLLERGFTQCLSDPCLFVRRLNGHVLFLAIYVDDLVYSGNAASIALFKEELSTAFEVTHEQSLQWILGMEVSHDDDVLRLSGRRYIERMLAKYGMRDAKPIATPANGSPLGKDLCPKGEEEKAEVANFPYRNLIGSILYSANSTRPDICAALSPLTKVAENPGKAHITAAKRILRYLKGEASRGLQYTRSDGPLKILCFADSDFAGDRDSCKSTSGFVFFLCGGPISWATRQQKSVALSTVEAEYVALAEAAKEAQHLLQLITELVGDDAPKSVSILGDNQGSLFLSKHPGGKTLTRHIDIRHHFVRDLIARNIISLNHIPTTNNTADIMTKSTVSKEAYTRHRDALLPFRQSVCMLTRATSSGERFGAELNELWMSINGVIVPFIIDSGCRPDSVISENLVSQLKLGDLVFNLSTPIECRTALDQPVIASKAIDLPVAIGIQGRREEIIFEERFIVIPGTGPFVLLCEDAVNEQAGFESIQARFKSFICDPTSHARRQRNKRGGRGRRERHLNPDVPQSEWRARTFQEVSGPVYDVTIPPKADGWKPMFGNTAVPAPPLDLVQARDTNGRSAIANLKHMRDISEAIISKEIERLHIIDNIMREVISNTQDIETLAHTVESQQFRMQESYQMEQNARAMMAMFTDFAIHERARPKPSTFATYTEAQPPQPQRPTFGQASPQHQHPRPPVSHPTSTKPSGIDDIDDGAPTASRRFKPKDAEK